MSPSAVVLVMRGGRALALTRGRPEVKDGALHDLHLPGGKWEPKDGYEGGLPNLRATACRELYEETGLRVSPADLRHLVDYTARNGTPIRAFVVAAPSHAPRVFGSTREGQPGWVEPRSLVQRWCTFGEECRTVLEAAGVLRRRRERPTLPRPFEVPTVRMVCPGCDERHVCAVLDVGARLPLHTRRTGDPLTASLCTFSFGVVKRSGRLLLDDDGAAKLLLDVAGEATAMAQIASAMTKLRSGK